MQLSLFVSADHMHQAGRKGFLLFVGDYIFGVLDFIIWNFMIMSWPLERNMWTYVIFDYELMCLIEILCWTEESGVIPIQEESTTQGAATKAVEAENDLPEPPTVTVVKPKYRLVQPSAFVPFTKVIVLHIESAS